MEPQELADILSHWYRHAPEGDSTTMIRLFGIVYVDEIGKCGATVSEIVRLSDISDKYNAEVSKGMRLARYVTVRPDWHFRI